MPTHPVNIGLILQIVFDDYFVYFLFFVGPFLGGGENVSSYLKSQGDHISIVIWAASLEQVYLVDSVCLTYSQKLNKINEFNLGQRVAIFHLDVFAVVVIHLTFLNSIFSKKTLTPSC